MSATATKTAQYKGRTYRLAYIGQTKFGRRAKLQFMDGSKEFWVDASLVSESSSRAATWQERENAGDRYMGTSLEGHYCGYPCPVTGRKCCPAHGPCHDCE